MTDALSMRRLPWLVLVCVLATGCASTGTPPSDVDFGKAAIVRAPADPVPVFNGPPSKGAGAGRGAAVGAGTGLAVGVIGCLPAGLFYPLCLAAVVPTATVIGAASGATVGAVKAEGAEAVAAKLDMLKAELAATPYQAVLAEHVQRQAHQRYAIDLPHLDANGPAASEWLIEVTLTEVTADGAAADKPFALWVEGRLALRRRGAPRVLYEASHDVMSETSLTTAQWSANGSQALHSTLDHSLLLLADKLLAGLVRSPAGARPASAP